MKVASAFGFGALLAATSAGLSRANAISFPLTSRPRSLESQILRKRVIDMNGSFGNGSTLLDNAGDRVYFVNITLGGDQFEVEIDTGSSDLWVAGNVTNSTDLHIPAAVSYAIGTSRGSINTANLEFDGFIIHDQAYINVVRTNATPAVAGILGLGPNTGSEVHKLVNASSGDSVLDRIFRQNMTTPNFLSFLLPRVLHDGADLGFHTGQLTIGSVVPGQEAIMHATKLPALVDEFGVQHWQTLLDANGIIGPDGEIINTTTTIEKPLNGSKDQLHVVLDSGFSLPQVPKYVADAIYGRVPNATFASKSDGSGYWRIPCDYELNISFVFAGVRYPVAPLDMTFAEATDDAGNPTSCGGSFQVASPQLTNHTLFGALDAILGESFLRNVYILINFGDFVDGSNSSVSNPYIQILSTTNLTLAHADFVTARLGGVDTTASQLPLLPPSEGRVSPGLSDDDDNKVAAAASEKTVKHATNTVKRGLKIALWIIILIVAVGIALLALVCFCVVRSCRSRRSTIKSEAAFVPAMSSYRPLVDIPLKGWGRPNLTRARPLTWPEGRAEMGRVSENCLERGPGVRPTWDCDGPTRPFGPYLLNIGR